MGHEPALVWKPHKCVSVEISAGDEGAANQNHLLSIRSGVRLIKLSSANMLLSLLFLYVFIFVTGMQSAFSIHICQLSYFVF